MRLRLKSAAILFPILFLSFCASPSHADIESNLVGWWKMDETSGNAIDSKGNGNGVDHGTDVRVGKFGNCRIFDGTSSYLAISNSGSFSFAAGQNFSVSAWIKRGDSSVHAAIVLNKGDDAANRYWFGYVDESNNLGRLYCNVYYGGANDHWVLATTNFTDTNWHHLVWVVNKTTTMQYVYYDGVLANSGVITDGSNSTVETVYVARKGASRFYGYVDDLRIYNRALSHADALELYQSKKVLNGAVLSNFKSGQ